MIRDDMHVGANSHIGVMVIPAAFALAQREGWTGDQLLRSIVGGYDMAAALGTAVRHAGLCNSHFRPSGIIGAFGSAAAGIVADGDISKITAISALSFGANMAAGLNEWAWAGGTEIYTQMGTASRNGIISLGLAKAGLDSSESVLEGRDGVFMAYRNGNKFGAARFAEWLTKSGIGSGIMDANFKPVAGCNFIQTPLSIALKLNVKVAGSIDQIRQIRISTTSAAKEYPGCDSLGPFDKVGQAKMSIQYGVAAGLLFGRIDESTYQQHDNATLQALIQKCTVVTESSFDEAFSQGKQPSTIEITMEDGSKYQNSLSDVPWLEGDAVQQRFKHEAAVLYSAEIVGRIMEECRGLQDAKNCSQLFDLLASAS
jgi:2-methylcitrate dehydratase PrpD